MITNRFDQAAHIEDLIDSLPSPIPLHIKCADNNKLNLANSSLHNLTLDDWEKLSQIIKFKNWTILNLSRNIIFNMSNHQIEAMSAIFSDSSISHLIIDNSLIGCNDSQLKLLTEKLPAGIIKTIEFGINDIDFFMLKKERCFALLRKMKVEHLQFEAIFDMSPSLSTRVNFVKELIESLHIQKLTLIGCEIENFSPNAFNSLLAACDKLRELELSGNNFARLDNSKWEMFHAFLGKASLETLKLNANELGKCAPGLIKIIENTKVEQLNLKNNWLFYLDKKESAALIESIKGNSHIKTLLIDGLSAKHNKTLVNLLDERRSCEGVNAAHGGGLMTYFIFNKPPKETLHDPEIKQESNNQELVNRKIMN